MYRCLFDTANYQRKDTFTQLLSVVAEITFMYMQMSITSKFNVFSFVFSFILASPTENAINYSVCTMVDWLYVQWLIGCMYSG